jgi:hypothetical protein
VQQASPGSARRQFNRNPVNANAIVHCGDRFKPAHIVDYSQGGLQLTGTFGLTKQDAVQVELMSGLRIFGKVAWSLGRHTGIVFSEPLAETHPAILELARRAARSLAGQLHAITHRSPKAIGTALT